MTAPVKPSKLIKGATGDWEVVIGMEIHAQVTSKSKLVSGASTTFGAEPNANVSLVAPLMSFLGLTGAFMKPRAAP
jgi:aspartyl-tRNA(Asn)/glutamyl-tRNA(Gln) amidotransferase subunit B